MLALKETYYKPVESRISRLLWDIYFAPLVAIIEQPLTKFNAAESAIIAAIKSGKIQYANGVFSGYFNVRISRELSSFATFDARAGVWRGNPGPAIKAAAIFAESKRKELQDRLNRAIDDAEATAKDAIESVSYGDDLPLFDMAHDIKRDLHNIGVMPEIDERTAKRLRKDYTESQKLNIKNWDAEQITRLREMVQRIQTSGDNASIKALIESEWGTSAAKARFLASQETRLFFDTLSRDRARRTGVRYYKWSTSHDDRVRESHRELDWRISKRVVDITGPGEIVDKKTGRRAHAGADFGCRCNKIWVLE